MSSSRHCIACDSELGEGDERCPVCDAVQPTPGTPPPTEVAAPTSETDAPMVSGPALRPPWDAVLEKLKTVVEPRYHVKRVLGYGGMAAVFMAEDPRLARRVAIKVMSPQLMIDSTLVERFKQEARTIAQLSHPSIVTIYEVEEREGLHYFSMSYVPGRTLADVLGDMTEPLPVDVVRAWLAQVGGALAYAHRSGIVHRDVKPGNILLDEDGNVHVSDFGIAKVADEPSLTRTGMLVGTPGYMSPEQCSSGQVDGASDQYSLGAVAYQMLTGAPPFSGNTITVLQAHVTQAPRPIREIRPDCPEELASAVERMLAKTPAERWPRMSDAITAMGAKVPTIGDPVHERMADYAVQAAAVTVEDPPTGLREGESRPLRATVRDARSRALPSRRVRWESSSPEVAAVDGDGELRALGPGRARITARCGHCSAAFEVRVEAEPVEELEVVPPTRELPRGRSIELSARARSREGGRASEQAVTWSTSDPAIARVSSDGRVEAVGPGTAVITATSGSISTALSLTVTEPGLQRAPSAAPAAPEEAPATPEVRPESLAGSPTPATPTPASPAPPVTPETTAAPATPATPAAQAPAARAGASASRPRRVLPLAMAGGTVVVGAVVALVVLLSRQGSAPVEPLPSTPPPSTATRSAPARPTEVDGGATAAGGGAASSRDAEAGGAARAHDRTASTTGAVPPSSSPNAGSSSGGTSTPTTPAGNGAPSTPATRDAAPPSRPSGGGAASGTALAGNDASGAGSDATPSTASGAAEPTGSATDEARGGGNRLPTGAAGGSPSRPAPSDVATGGGLAAPPVSPPSTDASAAEPAAPVRGGAADAAGVGRAIGGFVSALADRRVDDVIPLMPADARDGWRQLLRSPQVTEFSARLNSSDPPRFTAEGATTGFVVDVSFHNGNRTTNTQLRYVGAFEPDGAGDWKLTGLRQDGG